MARASYLQFAHLIAADILSPATDCMSDTQGRGRGAASFLSPSRGDSSLSVTGLEGGVRGGGSSTLLLAEMHALFFRGGATGAGGAGGPMGVATTGSVAGCLSGVLVTATELFSI